MSEEPPLRAATNLSALETYIEEAREHMKQDPEGHYVVIVLCTKLDDETVLDSVVSQYHHIVALKPLSPLRLVTASSRKVPEPHSPFSEQNRIKLDSATAAEPPVPATDPDVA